MKLSKLIAELGDIDVDIELREKNLEILTLLEFHTE